MSDHPDVLTAALTSAKQQGISVPMRYDVTKDELVSVTQEWVDGIGQLLARFGHARAKAKLAIMSNDAPHTSLAKASMQSFIDAWKPEHEQKAVT